MIVIVDYGMGNLCSVQKAVQHLGARAQISDNPKTVAKADKIIFPGVGHFGKAVKELKKRKLKKVLIERIEKGVPFLGICLGMQLLLQESEEAPGIAGLSVIKGKVRKFRGKQIIPHMGWNSITPPVAGSQPPDSLLKGVPQESYFYFAHSYYCKLGEPVILAKTRYGVEFASALNKRNVWGIQFHPEKSQALGLKVLNNFLTLC